MMKNISKIKQRKYIKHRVFEAYLNGKKFYKEVKKEIESSSLSSKEKANWLNILDEETDYRY